MTPTAHPSGYVQTQGRARSTSARLIANLELDASARAVAKDDAFYLFAQVVF